MTSPNINPLPTYRRPSYATVAAGGRSASSPYQFNTLAAVANTAQTSTSSSLASAQHPPRPHSPVSRQRSRSSLRSMEIDGHGADNALYDRRSRPVPSAYSNDFGRMEGGRMGCSIHDEHPPFFTPSYLKFSRHAQRLKTAYEEHLAELRENLALNLQHPPPSTTAAQRRQSLSASSSHASLNSKMHGSQYHTQRGPVQDVIERKPPLSSIEEELKGINSLPTKWSESDKAAGLEVLALGTEVRYNGLNNGQPNKREDEAASIRSDKPIPKEVGLYYFEVTILSRGKDGPLGIGFTGPNVSLQRLPGWEANSWAYHGDDGQIFASTASGRAYGPRYSSQDVVGCGINFRRGEAFFTKNGVDLGVAFSNIKADDINLLPCVGIRKVGEHLRVNFGQHPFVFDIDKMMAEERLLIQKDLLKADVSSLHSPDDERTLIHNLIDQYLTHEGYVETAKAFTRDVHEREQSLSSAPRPYHHPDDEDDVQAFNRQKIRRAILDGDIDLAFKYLSAFYPRILEEERNKDILFRLKCRKFIEMMRRCHELPASAAVSSPAITTKSLDSTTSNGHAPHPADDDDDDDDDDEAAEDDDADEDDDDDTQMELDDQLHREAKLPPTSEDIDMTTSQTLPSIQAQKSALRHHQQQDLLNAVYTYGAELRAEYKNDARPAVQKQLTDIFALIAYADPRESSVGGLMSVRGRGELAEEVNGAVLVSLGKPPSAALEKMVAQAEALLDETAVRIGGASGFVNVRQDFLRG